MNLGKNDPCVSICCIAYNQEKYIRNAIESFLMQKSSYSIEILIHDDASTDKTAHIIKTYADQHKNIKPIFQSKNQFSKNIGSINMRFVFPKAKGKYIAICDGDDYWTDPYKVQKQVDFLEKNSEYGLVFTDADYFDQNTGNITKSYDHFFKKKIPNGYVFETLLYINPFIASTALFTKSMLNNLSYPFMRDQSFRMGDKVLWLHIAAQKKIGYINQSMAVYRVQKNSASHSININKYISFIAESQKVSKYFADYFNYQISENKLNKLSRYAILSQCILEKKYAFIVKYINHPVSIINAFAKVLIKKMLLKL